MFQTTSKIILVIHFQPHDHPLANKSQTAVASSSSSTSSSVSGKGGKDKKRGKDAPTASRKNSTSIVQLRPPPPKVSSMTLPEGADGNQRHEELTRNLCHFLQTLQEKRQRLETTLTRLMATQRTNHPNAPEMDLSYLLTGRGARTKSSRAISNAVTSIT